jgi:hypothetical protein
MYSFDSDYFYEIIRKNPNPPKKSYTIPLDQNSPRRDTLGQNQPQ